MNELPPPLQSTEKVKHYPGKISRMTVQELLEGCEIFTPDTIDPAEYAQIFGPQIKDDKHAKNAPSVVEK